MPYLYTNTMPADTHNGYTWLDMPGNGSDDKRITFSLYRRGKIALELDEHGKLSRGHQQNHPDEALPGTEGQGGFITLGALAPPLSEQLDGFLDPVSIGNLQELADSLLRLHIAILSDSEVEKARRRFLKLLVKAVRRHMKCINIG